MFNKEALRGAELFQGLADGQVSRLLAFAQPVSLRAGEYLFLLGDAAERLYIATEGNVNLCFPFSFAGTIKDVSVECVPPLSPIGWSALVKPYRLTLSARAAQRCELAGFARRDFEEAFAADPALAGAFMRRIADLIGRRLQQMQALWVREVQRTLTMQLETQGRGGAAATA